MKTYHFSVVINAVPGSDTEILDMADSLGEAGCLDASLGGHSEGAEAVFDREADSLQDAINSAVHAIEKAGFEVKRVELERESLPAGA